MKSIISVVLLLSGPVFAVTKDDCVKKRMSYRRAHERQTVKRTVKGYLLLRKKIKASCVKKRMTVKEYKRLQKEGRP